VVDRDYVLAPAGLLAERWPRAADATRSGDFGDVDRPHTLAR